MEDYDNAADQPNIRRDGLGPGEQGVGFILGAAAFILSVFSV